MSFMLIQIRNLELFKAAEHKYLCYVWKPLKSILFLCQVLDIGAIGNSSHSNDMLII